MFEWKKFKSHSGRYLDWKIECDCLTKGDMRTVAELINDSYTFKCAATPPTDSDNLHYLTELLANKFATDDGKYDSLLVDDVLFSGRTVKAALDELFDHGRPAKVELAVLVDRGGRRLPVAADYCGLTLAAGGTEKVVVTLDPKDPGRYAITVQAV